MTEVERIIEEDGFRKGWIAKKAGIAPGTLSKIISGDSEPTLRVALKISKILNKTVEELWGHLIEEEKRPPV